MDQFVPGTNVFVSTKDMLTYVRSGIIQTPGGTLLQVSRLSNEQVKHVVTQAGHASSTTLTQVPESYITMVNENIAFSIPLTSEMLSAFDRFKKLCADKVHVIVTMEGVEIRHFFRQTASIVRAIIPANRLAGFVCVNPPSDGHRFNIAPGETEPTDKKTVRRIIKYNDSDEKICIWNDARNTKAIPIYARDLAKELSDNTLFAGLPNIFEMPIRVNVSFDKVKDIFPASSRNAKWTRTSYDISPMGIKFLNHKANLVSTIDIDLNTAKITKAFSFVAFPAKVRTMRGDVSMEETLGKLKGTTEKVLLGITLSNENKYVAITFPLTSTATSSNEPAHLDIYMPYDEDTEPTLMKSEIEEGSKPVVSSMSMNMDISC